MLYYDCFVSYRRTDKTTCALIVRLLQQNNFRVFVDQKDMTQDYFDTQIVQAIQQSTVFVVLLIRDALQNWILNPDEDWLHKEFRIARQYGKLIFPVRLDFTEIDAQSIWLQPPLRALPDSAHCPE